jgi:nucleotide-binding universal stress UspA family protein
MKTLAAKSSGKAGPAIDRILVAVDLAKHSETTALFAAQVAQSFDADLTVAHVFPAEPRYDFAGEGTFRAFEKRRWTPRPTWLLLGQFRLTFCQRGWSHEATD